jgi:hypothetical protein
MWRFRIKQLREKVRVLDLEPARYLNLGLASWLLVSAYLWPHSEPQFLITILLGAVVAIVAPFEVGSARVRKLNMAAGGALALAAVALPRTSALTLWHNVLVGLIIAGVAFFGPPHGNVPIRPEAPLDAYEATGGV